MKGKAEKKVTGGKLVKIRAEFDKTIKTIRILGDFFLHPEEAIVEIEKSLVGLEAIAPVEKFEERINETAKKHSIQMIGVSAKDIAETLKEALSK